MISGKNNTRATLDTRSQYNPDITFNACPHLKL
jgi:hypothetical protein